MKKYSAWLSTFIMCFLFWEVLVWSVRPRELLLGLLVSACTAYFACPFFIHKNPRFLYHPVRLLRLVGYCFYPFLWEVIKANISIAKVVLSKNPSDHIHSGVIRIKADPRIRSDYGLAMVSNSITLTPGTITMYVADDDAGDNYYYVQWMDVTETDREKAGDIIKGRMERSIAKIWGENTEKDAASISAETINDNNAVPVLNNSSAANKKTGTTEPVEKEAEA